MSSQGVSSNLIVPGDNATYFGFIAQDVEGRYPELVGRGGDGMRSVQYSAFVPLIIEGMKGQRRDVEDVEERTGEIEQDLTELRERVAELLRESGRKISVKGLASTGAVTAHHDLAYHHSHHSHSSIDEFNSSEIPEVVDEEGEEMTMREGESEWAAELRRRGGETAEHTVTAKEIDRLREALEAKDSELEEKSNELEEKLRLKDEEIAELRKEFSSVKELLQRLQTTVLPTVAEPQQ